MNRIKTEPMIPSQPSHVSTQAGTLTRWQSSSSFGSTAPEERRADKVFDRIEDLLSEMMTDPEQQRFHCRMLQGSFQHEQTPQVFNIVVIVTPPTPQL